MLQELIDPEIPQQLITLSLIDPEILKKFITFGNEISSSY
jgi:hypothetical protein